MHRQWDMHTVCKQSPLVLHMSPQFFARQHGVKRTMAVTRFPSKTEKSVFLLLQGNGNAIISATKTLLKYR